MFLRLFHFILIFAFHLAATQNEPIRCNILILGAGAGGMHTAYQLSKLPNQDICVIEKNSYLGGRLYDISMDPNHPDWVYGVGGLRVMETQKGVISLAQELGITLEYAPYKDALINTRGIFSFDSNETVKRAYPLVQLSEETLYQKLIHSPERSNAGSYPNLHSYMRAVIGPESTAFLHDVSRFRAEFEIPLDVNSYLDFLDEDLTQCCNSYYPVGGMSAFVHRMAERAKSRGVQFFTSEPVLEINSGYQIITPKHLFTGKKLVIAIDAYGFKYVGGDIARKIQTQRQFQDIFGVRVATVTQRFPLAWWEGISDYPGRQVRRAWTTENCLNALEIPLNPYATQQNVMRSVYDDDMRCVSFWENTYQRFGVKGVEREIMTGLHHLFPTANIPEPTRTVLQIWPAAWYYLKAGTRFTNREIAEWAVNPLPGEEVSLVGDSYHIQRSGWSEAAYKSSINTLNRRFGMEI